MFRYVGLSDLWKLIKAVVFSSSLIMIGILLLHRFEGYSRAIFIIDGILTFLSVGGLRFFIRLILTKRYNQKNSGNIFNFFKTTTAIPVLLYGAGNTGEKILRELNDNPSLHYNVVGFIDDNKRKWYRTIHGVAVLGDVSILSNIKKKFDIQEVFIASPSLPGNRIRIIVDECKKLNLKSKTLPSMGELIDGKVSVKKLRDVRYKDLLRRKPVVLDSDIISDYLKDKVVMVTGAGGSIGGELCRQIIKFQPKQLVLFDNSEHSLYRIQMELKHRLGYQRYRVILGRVQNVDLIKRVMEAYKPDVIFHAAAYKHVPMLERNPWQAVTNNIQGLHILLEKAVEYKVGHFVLVSTDKAVRPTNVMGVSKRICELLIQSYFGNGTAMMTVRFGNVVGSSGSVVPLFRKQIEMGGPVTVTHPEVTRFFMTIPEASQLILQAGAQGKGGEIFILDMGVSVKIIDIARDLIKLSGKEPDKDIRISFTGLRQGEKLCEELIAEGEGIVPTVHEKIMVLKPNDNWNGLKTQKAFHANLITQIQTLYKLATNYNSVAIRNKMNEIVPEYKPQDSTCVF